MSNVPSAPTPRRIGSTSSPTSTGVIPVPMQTPNRAGSSSLGLQAGILDRQRRRADGEPHGPAHQLQVLLVLAQVGQNVEVLDLARDLDAQARRVEALDVVHAGTPLEDRLAELATADPIGRNDADSGHHHAVHWFPHAQSSLYHRCGVGDFLFFALVPP